MTKQNTSHQHLHTDCSESSPSTIEVVVGYLRKGFSVIPLKAGTKKPALHSWKEYQTRQPTSDEVSDWWQNNPECGVAIVCGKVSGLIVVDIDDPKKFKFALNALGLKIPKTPVVKTKRGYHIYFRYPKGYMVKRHYREDYGAEIRGDDHYVVAPPSVVNGHKYSWWCKDEKELPVLAEGREELSIFEVEPAEVPIELLEAFGVPKETEQPESTIVNATPRHKNGNQSKEYLIPAIVALLQPYWVEGQRHDLSLALSGALAKAGWSWSDAEQLLNAIAEKAEDNELKDRLRALKDTFEKAQSQLDSIAGWSKLRELLPKPTLNALEVLISDRKQPHTQPDRPIKLLTISEWLAQINTHSKRWIVDGLLSPSWLAVLHARPKTGKSLVTANLMVALIEGSNFLGFATEPCAVLLIDLERPLETAHRLEKLGFSESPYIFVPSERLGADRLSDLTECIRQIANQTQRPVVVVIDTLTDFLKPALRQRKATLNAYDDVAEVLQQVREVALQTGAAFWFVHHERKARADEPSEMDILGSTAIAGKFDVLANLRINRSEDGSILTMTLEGNAVLKTTLHFTISDDFRLESTEPPALKKEDKAACEIQRLLRQYPEGKYFGELVDYLLEIGLAESKDAAKRLTTRALKLVPDLVRAPEGRNVRYRLSEQTPLKPIGDKATGSKSLSPLSPVQRDGSKLPQNREFLGDKPFVTNCHQLSPVSKPIGDIGDKSDKAILSPMSPMSPIGGSSVPNGDKSHVSVVTNQNPNEIRQNQRLVTQVTNTITLSPVTYPDEVIDLEAFAAETENSLLPDTEKVHESTDNIREIESGFVSTEAWLVEFYKQ